MPRRQKKIRSPLKMQGGKGQLRSKILPYLPQHKTYVEPFGGGASVLLAKEKSKIEVYNDINKNLVAVFRTIKNPDTREEFIRRLWLTPYSREERVAAREKIWFGDDADDEVQRARMFWVLSRQSFGGMIDRSSWGLVTNATSYGMAQPISSCVKAIRDLRRLSDRLKDVVIKNENWPKILRSYDRKTTLFYLDPPYPEATRSDGWFADEMSDKDHEKLVGRILKLKSMVVLSGYSSDIYNGPLQGAGWELVSLDTVCYAAGRTDTNKLKGRGAVKRKQRRQERLWMNPASMAALGIS